MGRAGSITQDAVKAEFLRSLPGPIAIATDGKAYFTYSNIITNRVVDFSTCNSTGTTDNFLRLISMDSSGAATRQLLHEYKGVSTLTYGAPGSGIQSTTHMDLIPVPVPAGTIADGSDGVLAAWSYVVPGGYQDCTYYGGPNPVCSALVPDAAQAKVSHVSPTAGITEYVAPLQNWLAESTYSVILLNNGGNQLDPGTLMLLGDNGVAYGTNGDKLVAFDSTSGSQLWQASKQAAADRITLYAATTDQNNHASVMGMDFATSQQQMLLFDRSAITPSPLGLLNPDYDPATQSWFGYSPALGAQAVVQTAQFAPQEDEWAFFQAPAGRRAAHVDVSFRQTANCSGFDGHVTDHNEEWLMVPLGGTQAAPTQGSNDVIAHANVDFGQVDFISSDTTKATVALGAINHHDITLTVTGLLKDEGTTIKAVDHQDHNTVYATLHLAIRPRIEKNLYLFSVSQQDTPQSARTLTPTRLPNATALQNLLESIYGRQANVHVTVHGDPQNNNVPISIGTNYDLNRDGRLQNDGENSPLSAEGSTLFNGIVDYYGCGAAGGNCTMDQNGYFASYVHALSQDLAIAERPGRLSITGDTHVDSTELTTAHELVHNFDIRDLCDPQMVNNVQQCIHDGSQPGPGNLTDRIAWHFDNNPGRCRLTKDEWDVINKPSGQQ